MPKLTFNPEVSTGHLIMVASLLGSFVIGYSLIKFEVQQLKNSDAKQDRNIEKLVEIQQSLAVVQAKQQVTLDNLAQHKH